MQLACKLCRDTAKLPSRGTPLSAGLDLYAAVAHKVPPRGRALVETGLKMALLSNTYARILPRSGIALKNGIDTGAGVIDADYRGEIMVILFNHSDSEFEIKIGDRIAQLVVSELLKCDVFETDDLDSSTTRGEAGFGSTGK